MADIRRITITIPEPAAAALQGVADAEGRPFADLETLSEGLMVAGGGLEPPTSGL